MCYLVGLLVKHELKLMKLFTCRVLSESIEVLRTYIHLSFSVKWTQKRDKGSETEKCHIQYFVRVCHRNLKIWITVELIQKINWTTH
jgi:hypothetical protein